jgi:hypothetical protein
MPPLLRVGIIFMFREVWESTRKFGNFKNFFSPKISFSKYIECMVENEKYEIARYLFSINLVKQLRIGTKLTKGKMSLIFYWIKDVKNY